ncbi:hypothetical protein VUR80DRAFT_3352 [Thermomyces stellatus]
MSADTTQKKDVSSSLSKLSLDKPTKTKSKPKEPVVDSWEDEDVSSDSDREATREETKKPSQSLPSAPPPTPISPSYNNKAGVSWPPVNDQAPAFTGRGSSATEQKRPEKTDVVARRMIAGALGMNAVKPTAEQKAYDKAVREQVKRAREQEKEAERKRQEEAQKAKAAIWED